MKRFVASTSGSAKPDKFLAYMVSLNASILVIMSTTNL